MSRSNVRLVIKTAKKTHPILSVSELPNGDLTLDLWVAEYKMDLKTFFADEKLTCTKMSIHASPKSLDGNLITYESSHPDEGRGKSKSGRLVSFTRAIKTTHLLAPVFTRRMINVDAAPTVTDAKGQYITIDDYDPTECTFYYAALVSSKTRMFDESKLNSCVKYKLIDFVNFRLVILWTFSTLPSNDTSEVSIMETTKDDSILTLEGKLENQYKQIGLDERGACLWFLYRSEQSSIKWIRYVGKTRYDFLRLMYFLRFFEHGYIQNERIAAHVINGIIYQNTLKITLDKTRKYLPNKELVIGFIRPYIGQIR